MSVKYLRKARLKFIGGSGMTINPANAVLLRDEMMIDFTVSKSVSGTENSAEINVWNLKESTRNAVGKEFDEVELECGYIPPAGSSVMGLIFKGAIRDVEHTREGPDIVTTIRCGDGDKALRQATLSRSYAAGTPVEDVLDDIQVELEKFGAGKGEWQLPDDLPTMKRPYAVCGLCSRELNRLGRAHKFYWSLQNQETEIVPGDGALSSSIKIDGNHVIDTTITDNGIIVRTFLEPGVRPNHRVQVESPVLEMNAANGEYRVSQCVFRGNSREGDFIVEIHGEAMQSGGKVDEGKKSS